MHFENISSSKFNFFKKENPSYMLVENFLRIKSFFVIMCFFVCVLFSLSLSKMFLDYSSSPTSYSEKSVIKINQLKVQKKIDLVDRLKTMELTNISVLNNEDLLKKVKKELSIDIHEYSNDGKLLKIINYSADNKEKTELIFDNSSSQINFEGISFKEAKEFARVLKGELKAMIKVIDSKKVLLITVNIKKKVNI